MKDDVSLFDKICFISDNIKLLPKNNGYYNGTSQYHYCTCNTHKIIYDKKGNRVLHFSTGKDTISNMFLLSDLRTKCKSSKDFEHKKMQYLTMYNAEEIELVEVYLKRHKLPCSLYTEKLSISNIIDYVNSINDLYIYMNGLKK